MKIYFHRYTLYARGTLNAASRRRDFEGALLLAGDGVGCLHPWPEFGDAPIEDQLSLLAQGGTSRVIERALHMAAVDGDARRKGVSLFDGLTVPVSHYSWDTNQPSEAQMQRVQSEGWGAIKSKGWPNVGEVLRWMDSYVACTRGGEQIGLRVDFNSCLEKHKFVHFMEWMPARVRGHLDFVEDPFPFDASAWSQMQARFGVSLALDKQLRGASTGFDVAVLKPGRRDWRDLMQGLPAGTRVVMTSAMDHAIGQSFAAFEAAQAATELGGSLDLCGLCTEHLFARDSFFERVSSVGGVFQPDRAGTGLGFDDILQRLPWQRLVEL